MRGRLLALLRSASYRPLTKSGLARALEVPPDERAGFREVLRGLEREGVVVSGKKSLYSLRQGMAGGLTGTMKFLAAGDGVFLPDRSEPETKSGLRQLGLDTGRDPTIAVAAANAGTALPGDRVVVKASLNRKTGAVEAKVVRVVERSRRRFVATLVQRGHSFSLAPDDPSMPVTFDLAARSDTRATPGHKVLAEVESWEEGKRRPVARLVKDLGSADTPGVAILTIIHKHGLPTEFPPAVMDEVAAMPSAIPREELAVREDWRDRDVVTIDPDDARDFDDAIWVHPLSGGGWELAVHIADVSYYVRPGTHVDREARERGNSVYLADRVLPMLPEKLSNGLCSLQPDVDRLTRVAVMRFDAKGRRTAARFARAVIRSRRRFTYEEAFTEMKAADPARRSVPLDRAWPLAALLRRRRFAAGSLDLDFPEVRTVLDSHGVPVGLKVTHNDESHQLIEEFMLAANEAVAKALKDARMPSVYRVHEEPDEEKLEEYAVLAVSSGLRVGDLTQRSELQKLLGAAKGRPDEHALKLGLLKSLKRAVYHAEPRGHYGLAKNDYAHFTSPIRRYADLIVHRALGTLEAKQGSRADQPERLPSQSQMVDIADHLSQTERTAAEAEQESQRLMQTEYFSRLLRLKSPTQFQAVIVEVRRMGVFLELRPWPVRGLVRPDDFPEGEYQYDDGGGRFFSRRPRRVLAPGREVTVVPARVHHDRRLIDFRIVG
ncbi:MAG: ribonuclease R [Verrucomicrobiales bacterium]